METLEFIIYPNGRVEERITGISGNSCAEITAAIEEKLGIVAHRELTSENFVDSNINSDRTTQQVSDFSQW
jgi:hypothetical protein